MTMSYLLMINTQNNVVLANIATQNPKRNSRPLFLVDRIEHTEHRRSPTINRSAREQRLQICVTVCMF